MRILLAAVIALAWSCSAKAEITRYTGGYWYDGEGFGARDVTIEGGLIVEGDHAPDRIVDIAGAYVVPGFAEAHHHMVICNPPRIEQFIRAGIVYAGIMNARTSSRACQAQMHGADGLEVTNALAGITATDAHPSQIGLYFLEPGEIDGEWVHYLDSADDLDRVWSQVEATHPDIVKVFLSNSGDYGRLRADDTVPAWYKGLDPALVAPLVERAHAAGLRVAAHVISAHDFEVAVDAGVDMIAHMPGFAPYNAFTPDETRPWFDELRADPSRYRIPPEVARRAAAQGVAVQTTVSEVVPASADLEHNFAVLQEAGVTLLIGSDRGEFNSVDEAVYLVEQNLMSAEDVLRSLSLTTPQALFPGRAISTLAPGHEATFVVLGGNPLEDFENIRDVDLVVKQGTTIYQAN